MSGGLLGDLGLMSLVAIMGRVQLLLLMVWLVCGRRHSRRRASAARTRPRAC